MWISEENSDHQEETCWPWLFSTRCSQISCDPAEAQEGQNLCLGRRRVLLNSPQWEKSALLPALQRSRDITSHSAGLKTLKSNGQVPGKLPDRTFSSASRCIKWTLISWMMMVFRSALIILRNSTPLFGFSLKWDVPLLPSRYPSSPACPWKAAILASLLLISGNLDCLLIIFWYTAAKGGIPRRHRFL